MTTQTIVVSGDGKTRTTTTKGNSDLLRRWPRTGRMQITALVVRSAAADTS